MPGWECQPDEPPGAMLTVAVTKSTGPFVLSLISWVLALMEGGSRSHVT